MALSEIERRIVATVEESWMSRGTLLTPRDVASKFGISEAAASKLLQSDSVREAFKSRGIPETDASGLTPEQVTAINTVVNPMDTRSRRKKLADMDISATKWAGWMKQAKFKDYLAGRSTDLLQDAIPEAHMALVDNVMRGDFGSIKFLYEMTGTYDSNKSTVDIPMLINRVFDILIRHIADPETLMDIAKELQGLVGSGNLKPAVQGEIVQSPVAAPLDEEPPKFSL